MKYHENPEKKKKTSKSKVTKKSKNSLEYQ